MEVCVCVCSKKEEVMKMSSSRDMRRVGGEEVHMFDYSKMSLKITHENNKK